MKTHTQTFLVFFLLLFVPFTSEAQLPKVDPPRAWTTAKGEKFTATLLSFDGTTAVFKMPNLKQATAPLTHFSEEDQKHLHLWKDKQPIQFTMPEIVSVLPSSSKVEVLMENEKEEKFLYRTPHFEFESQAKLSISLLREISRIFEATYELLKALPWNIEPSPPGEYFKARLFKTRDDYHKAGGHPNSGGVYMSHIATFLAPFSSIGLKPLGKGYTKSDNFDSGTLVHELTHQMMHGWLGWLPIWVVEGTAEYTKNIPLNVGRFRVVSAKTGLKDYTNFLRDRTANGIPEPYDIEKLFKISNLEWAETLRQDATLSYRMYFTSYLLVYYFMHLDGGGDSQRFIRYFRSVDQLRKAPRHSSLSQKEREAIRAKTLDILLDGRTVEELIKQIRTAYMRLGIKL